MDFDLKTRGQWNGVGRQSGRIHFQTGEGMVAAESDLLVRCWVSLGGWQSQARGKRPWGRYWNPDKRGWWPRLVWWPWGWEEWVKKYNEQNCCLRWGGSVEKWKGCKMRDEVVLIWATEVPSSRWGIQITNSGEGDEGFCFGHVEFEGPMGRPEASGHSGLQMGNRN